MTPCLNDRIGDHSYMVVGRHPKAPAFAADAGIDLEAMATDTHSPFPPITAQDVQGLDMDTQLRITVICVERVTAHIETGFPQWAQAAIALARAWVGLPIEADRAAEHTWRSRDRARSDAPKGLACEAWADGCRYVAHQADTEAFNASHHQQAPRAAAAYAAAACVARAAAAAGLGDAAECASAVTEALELATEAATDPDAERLGQWQLLRAPAAVS